MTQRNLLKNTFLAWAPFAIIIMMSAGLVYVAVQQDYRTSANDPQIQIVEDVITALNKDKVTPDGVVPAQPVTALDESLQPFVVMYDDFGKPIGASVQLDGKLPTLPSGVFDYAKKHNQDRFTWQPKSGIRIAAVVAHFGGKNPGFVLAGRSLRETEARENNLLLMCFMAGLLALLLSYAVLMFVVKQWAKLSHEHFHHAEAGHEHHHESSN